MFEQHFRTNEEVGALYSTEDLPEVVLHGNDLVSFLHNCDSSIMAGMKIVPGQRVERHLFATDSWMPEDQV